MMLAQHHSKEALFIMHGSKNASVDHRFIFVVLQNT